MGEEESKPQVTQDSNVNHKLSPSANHLDEEASRVIAIGPEDSSIPPPDSPSWFTPKRLLVIFCVINLLNYVDRGAIASNGVNGSRKICNKDGTCTAGSGIQGDFNLTNFKDGALSSAFMVGLLVASPIFASLAKRVNPFRLVGVGLSVWTIAALCCGLSQNFLSIAIFRMLVGVGEASFISLAAPFIDDNAPASQKNAWLAMFYMCIPSGVALGYVYGGVVAAHLSWRAAFYGEAILMTPFAVLGFFVKPLQMKGFSHTGSKKALKATETTDTEDEVVSNSKNGASCIIWSNLTSFGRDMKELLKEKVYVVNVLGYIAYNFVIGAYSYWGPKAGYSIYHMTDADMKFGGITILCGVLGTLGGGFVLDYMTSTLNNAFKLLSVTTFFGAVCCFAAFCFKNVWGFYSLFAIGELLVFATQGPVNFVCLHSVKPSLRPLSMAMSTVCIHIFGDVPSSPLVGRMQDHFHNWRTSALILTSVLFLASAIWFIGIFLRSVDRFNEESEEQPTPVVDKPTPLQEEKIKELSVAEP